MEYNSNRPDLVIPEYGRNIQNMVNHALEITNREERNKAAKTIIRVMGHLFPHLRDIEDYNHKLWDHLHIMAGFQLDVDSPYPMPDPEILKEGPQKVGYPGSSITYDHYGRYLEEFVKKTAEMEPDPEREKAAVRLANLMKTNYANFNQSHVEDRLIVKQLTELSGGILTVDSSIGLADAVILPQQTQTSAKRKKKKKKRNNRQGQF